MSLAEDIKRVAAARDALELTGVPEGFDALVMADLARARGGLNVFVARDGSRAGAFEAAMGFFAPEIEILRLPAWDCLPYDRIGPSAGVSAERMATLTRLARGGCGKKPALLLTHAPALMQRAAAEGRGAGGRLLRPGRRRRRYGRRWSATSPSTAIIAPPPSPSAASSPIRGGVIDVFPPGADEPVRLDLFGDTLEIDPRLRSARPSARPGS